MWCNIHKELNISILMLKVVGGQYDKTLLLGIQAYIREVLMKPITQEQIDFADKFWTAHEPFNRAGWQYIF